jgi:long-chain acyl-CoA synthetase
MHGAKRMSSHFLYEQWLATAQRFSRERALLSCGEDRAWTFQELLDEAEREKASSKAPLFPQGNGAEFILSLLRAWRSGSVACPLDGGQAAPDLANLPEYCAHVKITSASSGPPKCILFRGEQLAADAENIVSTMGLRPEWPNLGCISLAHSYGFSNLVLPLLLHGIPLILAPTPLPEMLTRAARHAPAITLPALPALWKAWHDGRAIPPNTRLAISAGAPLPLPLEREIFEGAGLKIHNFYGSSECGGIAYDRTTAPRSDAAFAGSALDNVRLSLSPQETLVVESAAVGETYWPRGESALAEGRFETTDLAEIRDGVIYLRGRLTDLLNIAGRKASPESIETALRAHPEVLECVVFGLGDPANDRGETVVAAAHTRSAISVADLTQFLSQRIPAWQIPRQWWFTTEIQPNSRGKISRAEWKRRFIEAQAR